MGKTAISKCDSKFEFYEKWLKNEKIHYEVLEYKKNNFEKIKDCSSLILTGGNDISSKFSRTSSPSENQTIPERDEFESRLLDFAFEKGLPVLGICRGMQFINCKLNGTLIADIAASGKPNHDKIEGRDIRHNVIVKHNSLLEKIVGQKSGEVNSSHHQGVEKAGDGLFIAAKSEDGIAEAIEWRDKNGRPFLLGVQWHPERMEHKNVFSGSILKKFKSETEGFRI